MKTLELDQELAGQIALVKRLVREAGVSAHQLCKRANVNPGPVQKRLQGKEKSLMKPATLAKLQTAADTIARELSTGDATRDRTSDPKLPYNSTGQKERRVGTVHDHDADIALTYLLKLPLTLAARVTAEALGKIAEREERNSVPPSQRA